MNTVIHQISSGLLPYRLLHGLLLLLSLFVWSSCATEDDGGGGTEQPANLTPTKPVITSPPNNATNYLPVDNLTITWKASTDPTGDGITYDVFLYIANEEPTKVASDITETTFTLSTPLKGEELYFCEVQAKNKTKSQMSEITRFRTVGFNPEMIFNDQDQLNSFDSKAFETTTGRLFLNGTVSDLSPLSSLKQVRLLEIVNTTQLTSLKGLENLEKIDTLRLYDNKELTSIDLPNVTFGRVEGFSLPKSTSTRSYIFLRNNPKIETMSIPTPSPKENSVDVKFLDDLKNASIDLSTITSLGAAYISILGAKEFNLSNLTKVEDSLWLYARESIGSIHFDKLRTVGTEETKKGRFFLRGDVLQKEVVFPELVSVFGRLDISIGIDESTVEKLSFPKLTTLLHSTRYALSFTSSATTFEIPQLKNYNTLLYLTLPNLETPLDLSNMKDAVYVYMNILNTTIKFPDEPFDLRYFIVNRISDKVKEIDFGQMQSATSLYFTNIDQPLSIKAPNLTSIKYLTFKENESITSLGSFPMLSSIDTLTISENKSLTDFCALKNVTTITDYTVEKNKTNPTKDELKTLQGCD